LDQRFHRRVTYVIESRDSMATDAGNVKDDKMQNQDDDNNSEYMRSA